MSRHNEAASALPSARSTAIAVYPEGDTASPKAAELARQLQLPLVSTTDVPCELLLAVTPRRIELRSNQRRGPGPVYVDFVGGALGYSRRVGGSRLLFRAVGFGHGPPSVIDATAGLGQDAFLLAARGCRVIAIERSAIVAALLQDGIDRAVQVPELQEILRERLRVVVDDAREYLEQLSPADAPDVVYLDPMFPTGRKSALVGKEMRILRRVVGGDEDAGDLLKTARAVARRHVVVKRMRHAPALAPAPTRSYAGKSTRYDVYACGR